MGDDDSLRLHVELGLVPKFLEVPELTIREVARHGVVEELDGHENSPEEPDPQRDGKEYRVQGRIVNGSKARLSHLKYDVSYYDAGGQFLGLDRSRFLEEDELGPRDHLAFDMRLDIPAGTHRCVFNARAKPVGPIGRLFWG